MAQDSLGYCPGWCKPLRDRVAFEEEYGKIGTLAVYNPLTHWKCVPLNHDIPSIYGNVDVDWMLRVATLARSQFAAWFTYRYAKIAWNAVDRRRKGLDLPSLYDPANMNAPYVAHQWLAGESRLREIFKPALDLLAGMKHLSCTLPD